MDMAVGTKSLQFYAKRLRNRATTVRNRRTKKFARRTSSAVTNSEVVSVCPSSCTARIAAVVPTATGASNSLGSVITSSSSLGCRVTGITTWTVSLLVTVVIATGFDHRASERKQIIEDLAQRTFSSDDIDIPAFLRRKRV